MSSLISSEENMANIQVATLEELLARKRAAAATSEPPVKLARVVAHVDGDSPSKELKPAKNVPSPKARPASNHTSAISQAELKVILAAVREGPLDQIRRTLSEHPDVRLADADHDGYSILHALVQYNFPQLLALWLEKGLHGGESKRATINAQDRWRVSSLLLAAANGHGECVLLLLRHGADPAAQDCKGLVAEDWARRGGHSAIIKALQDHVREPRR
jgi:ankyrin repeat protein